MGTSPPKATLADDSGGDRRITAVAAVVEAVAEWMAERATRAEIEKRLQALFPTSRITDSLIDGAMKKARQLMLSRLRRSPDRHRAQALAFYEGIVANTRAKVGERLAAQQAIVNLLGLSVEPVKGETPEDSARAAREFLAMSQGRTEAPTVEEVEEFEGDAQDAGV